MSGPTGRRQPNGKWVSDGKVAGPLTPLGTYSRRVLNLELCEIVGANGKRPAYVSSAGRLRTNSLASFSRSDASDGSGWSNPATVLRS